MNASRRDPNDLRIDGAIDDLRALILARYPEAMFYVFNDEDSGDICLNATVDIDDTDDVMDVVIDRLVEIQVDEELPIWVTVALPLERAVERFRAQQQRGWSAADGPSAAEIMGETIADAAAEDDLLLPPAAPKRRRRR